MESRDLFSSDSADCDEECLRERMGDDTVRIVIDPRLEVFWRTSQELWIKRALFLAIPVNTALCGCEYWAMTDKLHDRLSAFCHKTLRCVLGINMFAVKGDRIKNEHL